MKNEFKEHPLDCVQNILRRYITRFDCVLFAVAYIATLLVHLYMFTHKFINHDDIGALYTRGDYGIYSGRWLIAPLTGVTGYLSSSWLNGIVAAAFLAVAVVLIVRIFGVRHRVPAVLMAVCLVSFPVIASTYTYMCGAVPYMFALCAAVCGAWLIRSEKLPLMAVGSIAIALAMGCYQSYFCLAVVILVVTIGLDLLDNRFEGSWKRIFLTGVKYVFFLAVGMVLYFIILKICLHVKHVGLVSYQGLDTMGQLSFDQMIQRIKDAYRGFYNFFTNKENRFHGFFVWLVAADVIFTLSAIVIKVKKMRTWRSPATMIFLALIIILFPLASGLMYVMVDSSTASVHLVMMYPMVMLLLFPAIVLDRLELPALNAVRWKKSLCAVFAVALLVLQAAIGYECILITNRAYFAMDITYENTYAFYTKLAAKLELQDGYTPETPVAFIGRAKIKEYAPPAQVMGALNVNSALNMYTVPYFLKYLVASEYKFVSPEQETEISALQEFQEMPVYPAEGSIATINGVIVVKFSG